MSTHKGFESKKISEIMMLKITQSLTSLEMTQNLTAKIIKALREKLLLLVVLRALQMF